MAFQRAPDTPEREMLLAGQVEIAEEQDLVAQEQGAKSCGGLRVNIVA